MFAKIILKYEAKSGEDIGVATRLTYVFTYASPIPEGMMINAITSLNGIDLVTVLINNDVCDIANAFAVNDMATSAPDRFQLEADISDVLSIIGINKFHELCNTVRSYSFKTQQAAWVKYSPIYVESALKVERDKAYATHVARPHFGPLKIYSIAPTFSPDAVRAAVAAFSRS